MSDIGTSVASDTASGPVSEQPAAPVPSSLASPADQYEGDILEKYRSLKRQFDELEEKQEEGSNELNDTNAQIRHERSVLLERILELEAANGGAELLGSQNDGDEPPAKRQRSAEAGPSSHAFSSNPPNFSLEMIDPTLSATPAVEATRAKSAAPTSPVPTRRSTRARKSVNYNDDDNEDELPAKPEKPAPRKPHRKVAEAPVEPPPQVSTPSTSASATATPTPTPAAPQPAMSFNPYSLYYPTPGQATAPFPYPYYYMHGMMPYPPPPMPGMPGPSQAPPNPPPPQSQRRASGNQPKPKRLKTHTVTSKNYSIPMVPRDKRGKPMLPLNVGIMTVISLGEVCMREHFHTERYIFPVGYEVTRRYMSTIDATSEVVYHCTILDGGDGPKFQIVPNDVPDKPVIAGTATGAWSTIVKQANAIRNRQHSNSVSGPDFFGLGQNTIKHLIQQLPNAEKLRDYVWQHFVEGGPLGGRHAAVIPALPEEYDSSTPIGAFYPSERDKLQKERAEERAASGEPPKSHYPPHIMAQAAARPGQRLQQPQQPQQQQQPQPPPQQTQPQTAEQMQHFANVTFDDLLRFATGSGALVNTQQS